MQTFQVIAPEGALTIDTITGYPVGETTPEVYENAKFDVLELLSTLAGRMPLIPVPISAMSYSNQGQEIAREMASIARYKEAIYEQPKPEPKAAPQDSPVLDEFLALISKLQAAGYSVAGVVVKKDDETDTVAPFLCTAKGKEGEKEVETMRDAVHSLLHEEGDETQKMIRLLVGVFLGGYSQYKLCTALSHEKDS